jgi:hypothetical protein
MADAQAKPPMVGRAQHALDVLQAVVARSAATELELGLPGQQVATTAREEVTKQTSRDGGAYTEVSGYPAWTDTAPQGTLAAATPGTYAVRLTNSDGNAATLADAFTIAEPVPTGDSVRTKIRKAIFYGLGQITTGSGYAVTFGDILKDERSLEQMINFPAVNVNFGRERYLNAEQGSGALGYLVKELPVTFFVFVKDINNVRQDEQRIIAGIEKYFLNNRCIPDSDGNSTVIGDTQITGSGVRGMETNVPTGVVTIDMRIVYHQSILDPTSTSPATTAPTFEGAPPASVTVSRRDALRLAVIRNLKTLTTDNGYNISVGDVNDMERSVEQFVNYPAVNVKTLPETYVNSMSSVYQDNVLRKEAIFSIDSYLRDVNDILINAEEHIADVEKLFMNYPSIPDSDGRRTCTECMLLSNEFIGMETNVPAGLVRIELKAYYRQTLGDPAQLVTG